MNRLVFQHEKGLLYSLGGPMTVLVILITLILSGCSHPTQKISTEADNKEYSVEQVGWLNNDSLIVTVAQADSDRYWNVIVTTENNLLWLDIADGTAHQAKPCGKDRMFVFSYHPAKSGETVNERITNPHFIMDVGIYTGSDYWEKLGQIERNFSPVYSPVQDEIAYGHDRLFVSDENIEPPGIYTFNLKDKTTKQITKPGEGEHDSSILWAPNGDLFAFTRMQLTARDLREDIWIVNRDGTDLIRLTYDGRTTKVPVAWSQDRKKILFEVSEELWSVDIDSGETEFILSEKDYYISPAKSHIYISRDTSKAALVSKSTLPDEAGLWIVDLKTGNKQRILAENKSFRGPAWSPGGAQIALLCNSQQVWIADATGKKPPTLILDLADATSLPTPDTVRTVELANPN